MFKQRNGWHWGLALSVFILAPSCAWADNLSSEPVEVRLWLAMSRAVSSTDAIGRHTSVAYLSASSDNPAASDLRDAEGENVKRFIRAETHHVVFGNGAWIAAGDANAYMRLKNAETVLFGYNHVQLADIKTRTGIPATVPTASAILW